MGYLDNAGLAHLWANIRSALAEKQDIITAGAGLIKDGGTLSVDIPVHRVLLQDEYDALTDEEKRHGLFFIQNWGGASEETPEESASYAGEEDGWVEDTAEDITIIDSIRIDGNLIGLSAPNIDGLPSGSGFPSGGIIIWSGASDAVPSGWALCDGANGTPDLRDRFVVGAGSTYAVGAKGGEAVHTLTENEMPRHRHDLPGEVGYNWLYEDSSQGHKLWIASDDPHDAPDPETHYTGGNQPHNNLPPYYALCYIMKL